MNNVGRHDEAERDKQNNNMKNNQAIEPLIEMLRNKKARDKYRAEVGEKHISI